MRWFLPKLFISFSIIVFISSCSDTSSGNRDFLQLFTATKDDPNKNELYASFSDFSVDKISGDLVAGGNVVEVALSPGGDQIAYVADLEVDERYELYIVSISGGDSVKISGTMVAGGDIQFNSAVEATSIQWSPDGSKISYIADQDTDNLNELYVINPDGSANTKVSGNITISGKTIQSVWSPDSSKIAYVTDQDTAGVTELYVSAVNGSSTNKVSGTMVVGGLVEFTSVNWSPDNLFISYIADQELDTAPELFVSTPDGLSNTKVSGPGILANPSSLNGVTLSVWSPNSNVIAYAANQESVSEFELFVSTPDGVTNTKVSGPMVVGGAVNSLHIPQWSQDASQIIYIAFQDDAFISDLYISTTDGTSNIQLSNALGSVDGMQWSNDGQWIAFGADQSARRQSELFRVSPDGLANERISTTLKLRGSGQAEGPTKIEWSPDDASMRISIIFLTILMSFMLPM